MRKKKNGNSKQQKLIDLTNDSFNINENKPSYRNKLKAKSENQAKAIDTINNNSINFISGPAGSGKTLLAVGLGLEYLLEDKIKKIVITRPIIETGASIGYIPGPQPLDAKILTPNGWKLMGEIKVDDQVIGRDGKATKVIGIYPKGTKDIYKVITKDGRSTECCLDHLWYTRTKEEKKLSSKGEIRSTRDIICDIEIGKKHFIPRNETVTFDSNDLPIPPYTLGVLLGDGHSEKTHIRFASADPEIVDRVNTEINSIGLYCKKFKKKYSQAYSYTICSKDGYREGCKPVKITDIETNKSWYFLTNKKAIEFIGCKGSTLSTRVFYKAIVDGKKYEKYGECWRNPILEYFKKANLYEKKAWDKFIPQEYKYSTVEDRLNILQGLLDTDGSCRKRADDQVNFYTTSIMLAKDVMEIVMSLGGKARLSTRDRIKETQYNTIKAKRLSYVVSISMPGNMNPFFLKRKAERFLAKNTNNLDLEISSIKKTGEKKQVQCIMIENPEHLYITDDYIVTHNTAEEKLHPYLLPILDSINMFISTAEYVTLKTNGKIEIVPLGFMRGRTFHNSFIIADECQNASYEQLKMLLTRIGMNSKMVLTGDIKQSDLPIYRQGGFEEFINTLYGIEDIGLAILENSDIIRHPIIAKILAKLDIYEQGRK